MDQPRQLPTMESGTSSVRTEDDNRNEEASLNSIGSSEDPDNQLTIFVVDNSPDLDSTTVSRCVSVNQLDVEVISLRRRAVVVIILMVGHWSDYEGGYFTLWVDCWIVNMTVTEECKNIARAEGPVWLELTRTMICVSLILYVSIFFCMMRQGPCSSADLTTFKGQLIARYPQISFFFIGTFIVTSAIFYDINFYDHYSKMEKKKDVRRSAGIFVAYICGSILWAVNILIAVEIDTGLKKYIKKKLNIGKTTSGQVVNVQPSGNAPQDVAVKSRAARFACLCQQSAKVAKTTEDNNHRKEQRDGSTQTELPMWDAGRNSVTIVRSEDEDVDPDHLGASENPNNNFTIFVVDNSLDLDSTTVSRCVSVNQLDVEVLSLAGNVINTDDHSLTACSAEGSTRSNTLSPRQNEAWANSFPVLNINTQRSGGGNVPDMASPSYNEAIKTNSDC